MKYNRSNGVTKKCPKCGLTKSVSNYYFNKKTGRIYSYCKKCDNKARAVRRSLEGIYG